MKKLNKGDSGSNLMRGASILKVKDKDKAPNMQLVIRPNLALMSMRKEAAPPEEQTPSVSEDWNMGIQTDDEMPETKSESTVDPRYKLPYFASAMFATVLEDTLASLRILSECNTNMRIMKTEVDMPELWKKKYSMEQPVSTDELEGVNSRNVDCDAFKLTKLERDRNFVVDTLTTTYTELCLDETYQKLGELVDTHYAQKHYQPQLMEEEINNKTQVRDLRKQLRQLHNYFKTTLYDTDAKIEQLVFRTEDCNLYAEIHGRFVNHWQLARTEQHHEILNQREGDHLNNMMTYKHKYDQEQRVHTETELVTGILINETLQEVETWMDKYDKDMEAIDLRIQIRKTEYQAILDKRINLEKTMEHHTELMRNWQQYKIERVNARLQREKMIKSALIVQAWWRGMLVRHQLGPFRPRKRGKKLYY